MRAFVQDSYGSTEALRLREVTTPVPADDQILVRVHAASLNARDWHVLRGDPMLARSSFGWRAPRQRIRGSDIAGRVEAVGRSVTRFAPGDEVFGDVRDTDGAFAEYVCLAQDAAQPKPPNLTFEEAATLPMAGGTALRGLRELAPVRAGHRVLINGASGGVGTFAVQIAKAAGAEVTGVCSGRNAELVRSLGADHVIDYTRSDFSRSGRTYDIVLDLVANRPLRAYRRVLEPGGTLLLSGGGTARSGRPYLVGPMGLVIAGQTLGRLGRQRVVLLTTDRDPAMLAALRELAEEKAIVPVIDRTYEFEETAEAMRYLMVEHARAKVVVRMVSPGRGQQA
ncbi:NAD(P)-dependent alcohol dehydrogenase [Actinoplanes aureus]|uniref:NAD(P)-dependent alcohol dehydrogenase n=1 Tax=Actinoplanes aureus TaxID=2792083 RepID=A0A931CEL7_9ACTN|nr:NAD(P)-dependent alcohol dehydrogenase [Actinoplanes aureus]MBG0565121.1 NAD(P)-dependent alcohol dehydrogenase [Actinoplanes aureus]